ncbi:MAG: phosphate signaling complex protein PhoU [Christensenellaceae bacterium]|jgi:phosphate transport system protein|nr:phosphate signaling complex protein PhoU [Christensenellaceae bacterium]
MFRNKLDEESSKLHDDLVKLGAMSEAAIGSSIEALMTKNIDLALTVVEHDKDVNNLTSVIESEALKILLKRHPVASDFRMISCALKIVSNIERIADQAQDIASITVNLKNEDYITKLGKIPRMADISKKMLKLCIDSFVGLDVKLAEEVLALDDELDNLFLQTKGDMVKLISNDPKYADVAIYLMMIAKYFEKIGDHAENIAEWVIFEKTGERKNFRLL